MKKYSKTLVISLSFLMLNLITMTSLFAQDPPPPPPAHGQTGNVPGGGGAAIGGGVLILALLGAGYGTKKWYDNHKKPLAE